MKPMRHAVQAMIEQLWRRGTPRDVKVVGFLVHRFPGLAPASFRAGGLRFSCALDEAELEVVLGLLRDVYWLREIPEARRRAAIRASSVAVAHDERGIAAFARAVSDGRTAWIYDVIVRPDLRRIGVGQAFFTFLLDHPAVRDARLVRLGTRDAMDFYRRFGFIDFAVAQARKPYVSTEMVLVRG